MNKTRIPQAWLRLTDEGSEGEWRDIWTGEKQNFHSIPWRLETEPTGFTRENCSFVGNHVFVENHDDFWAYDVDCIDFKPSICQDIKLYFRLIQTNSYILLHQNIQRIAGCVGCVQILFWIECTGLFQGCRLIEDYSLDYLGGYLGGRRKQNCGIYQMKDIQARITDYI